MTTSVLLSANVDVNADFRIASHCARDPGLTGLHDRKRPLTKSGEMEKKECSFLGPKLLTDLQGL